MMLKAFSFLVFGFSNLFIQTDEKADEKRYTLPFDVNRVILEAGFYNASHLATGGEHYIVGEIPDLSKKQRFWQLIDREGVETIVTLGDATLAPVQGSAEILHTKRFAVSKAEKIDQTIYTRKGHKLVHLHYSCSSNTSPISTDAMLLLHDKLNLFHRSSAPIFVQSDHAVGMSGVFIACREKLKQQSRSMDSIIAHLNQQRPFIIKEQEHRRFLKAFSKTELREKPSTSATSKLVSLLTCRHTL